MKAFLMILVIILTGLVFAVRHYSTRPTEAHRAVIAELMEDLEGSEFERDRLAAELARAKAALERFGGAPAYSGSADREPAPSVAVEPSGAATPVASTSSDERLRQLSEIYHRNHSELLKKKADREASMDSSRAKRTAVLEAPMSFSEQSQSTDIEGNVTGMRGVRTSNADRARAIAKRDDQIALIDAEIKTLSTQIAGVDAEMKRLDELYKNAIAKAKGEMAAP